MISETIGDVFQLNVSVDKHPTKYILTASLQVYYLSSGTQTFELFKGIDIRNTECHGRKKRRKRSTNMYVPIVL